MFLVLRNIPLLRRREQKRILAAERIEGEGAENIQAGHALPEEVRGSRRLRRTAVRRELARTARMFL